MKRIIIFLILVYFVGTTSYAQKKFKKNDFLIKLHPISLVDFFPAMEIGGSYFLKDNLAIQLKFSQKTNWFNLSDSYSLKGNRLSGELQYFFKRKLYLGFELGYMANKYSDQMSYRPPPSGEYISIEDEFNIDRQRFYFVQKLGMVMFCSNSLTLETYTGLGLQYQIKEVKNLEFDKGQGHIDNSGYFFFGPTYKEKNGVFGKFSLGFSLNYNFNRKKSG